VPVLVSSGAQGSSTESLFSFVSMGKVILHNVPDPEKNKLERAREFAILPFEEKLKRSFALIELGVKLNGGKPLKEPQGKGIIIRKPVEITIVKR